MHHLSRSTRHEGKRRKSSSHHSLTSIKLAFNIVIVIELILDTVNEEELSMKLRVQEESTFLLGVFREMKKQKDLSSTYIHSILFSYFFSLSLSLALSH